MSALDTTKHEFMKKLKMNWKYGPWINNVYILHKSETRADQKSLDTDQGFNKHSKQLKTGCYGSNLDIRIILAYSRSKFYS